VVARPHEIKGESVFAFVVLKVDRPTGDKAEAFTKVLRDHVSEQLGAIARPDDIRFADNLPKTRSGKIMRRLLRAIARNEDIAQDQDLSTLENPAIVEQLRGNEAALAAPAGKAAPKPRSAKKSAPKKKAVKKPVARKAPAKKAAAKKASKPAAKKRPAPKKKQAAARRKK